MNKQPFRHAISDRNLARELGFSSPAKQAGLLAAEGVGVYQLREKDLPAGELAELAQAVLAALQSTETLLLINGRADVAVAAGAHGVHLPSSPGELTVGQVRRVYAEAQRSAPMVTVSCHSLDEVDRVRNEQPTAILFGPIFGKSVAGRHVSDGSGLELLRAACPLAGSVPVLALGGITEGNTPACLEAGAAGVAGIRLFLRPSRVLAQDDAASKYSL